MKTNNIIKRLMKLMRDGMAVVIRRGGKGMKIVSGQTGEDRSANIIRLKIFNFRLVNFGGYRLKIRKH